MDNDERKYDETYGDIPREFTDRLSVLISELKIKKHARGIFDRMNYINSIKWHRVDFTIYLEPKATPRPRSGFGGRVFYVKGASDNRKRFNKFMDRENLDLITTPIKFTAITYFPIPKNMNKVDKILAEMGYIRPITKPDWDNVGKTYSDMIQDRLIIDDSLIVEGVVKKFYSIKPRVEIILEYMDEHDAQFNSKKIIKRLEREVGKK